MASDAAGSYRIIVDSRVGRARLERGAMGVDSFLNSALVAASWLVKEEVSSRAPEGVAGQLGAGLKHTVAITFPPGRHVAVIAPTAPYADAVEEGSRPHMPPVHENSALAQWCELKGLQLWPVAMSIKTKGTQAHPFVQPAYEATKEPVIRIFDERMRQFVEEV